MAEKLNKNRIRDTRLIAIVAILVFLFTEPRAPHWLHEFSEFLGFMLVIVCVLGRLYATTFIGGVKNHKLMTDGPFAMVRNPLYFFSLVGVAGVGLMSTRITVALALLGIFYIIFDRMITREEKFLKEKFGKDYKAYCAATPRLWPDFKKYTAPDVIEVRPQYVLNAVKDCTFWFLPYFVFELIDWLHATGNLPVLVLLP